MSFCVRSSQMVRCRSGQSVPAPGQAATFARVRSAKMPAPREVKLMLTTQPTPLWSMVAVAFWMSSPVKPTKAGL